MRRRSALFFALGAILFCAGCGQRETPVELGNRAGIIHLGNGAEPHDLDPAIAVSVTDSNIVTNLFEGLVNYSTDGTKVLPGAAARWEISPDGKKYTFHLRDDLKWSNGDPLTSADFLYSFRRLIEPRLGSELGNYADPIAGAQDYREGKTTDFSAVGLAAPDAHTFEITLRERAPYLLMLLAINPFYPVHQATIEKFDAYLRRDTTWAHPGTLVCNGPFVLKDWRTNVSLTLEKNPAYHDAGSVRLHAAVFHPIDNAETEERAFRAGLLHVTRFIPAAKMETYRREHSPLLHSDALIATCFVKINCTKPPFDNPLVRRAFAAAIDRAALVRNVRRDGSRPADTLCVPGSGPEPGYVPRARFVYDPAAAQRDLATARGNLPLPAITLTYNTSRQGSQALCEAMQAMWQKTLGVRVNLSPQEEKVFLDASHTKNYELLLYNWLDINDPTALLQLFLGDSPNNDVNWQDAAYDHEYAAAAQAATNAERWTHLENADGILAREVPLIPLYHENQNYLVQPSVQGWVDNSLGVHILTTLSLQPNK